ncbi:bcl-2-like protein 15 [Sinocyclocheilus anshuiensis]|uniref:bcl-2-like protein 15 n=1 Tax=Sinocyclocheilus anshuiensis TaxID=1608454 RepID=UPI0007B9FD3C|nr:PREDICTED: bcl-2-like protein 15 [Sinocyclocheilus anshuiensis]
MAAAEIQKQTYDVIHCLLQNELYFDVVEPDGAEDENSFDPVKIASKLRELGDDYDERVIQPLMKNVQKAAADQVVTAFSDSVDSLCKMWVVERAEVASEKQLLKAAITLGLFMKKNCPDMTSVVESAMMGFVNNRLTYWIAEQGGWVSVSKNSMY